jgi:thiamine-phosphate pyrophosphorylase
MVDTSSPPPWRSTTGRWRITDADGHEVAVLPNPEASVTGLRQGDASLPTGRHLATALRLLVVTDRGLAHPRSVPQVVDLALRAGCRAVQLRRKDATAGAMLDDALELRELTRRYGALLFVNDRVDVALAAEADGVHLGPDDVPVDAVRRWVGRRLILGYSTDDPETARTAVRAGADYLGCGAVFGTRTKDVGDEVIGVQRLNEVARAVDVPVVGIGGVRPENVRRVAESAASGVAVVGAVMAAPDPEEAARRLLAPFSRGGP